LDSQRDDAVAKNQTDLTNQRHINRARPPLGTLDVCIIQVLRKEMAENPELLKQFEVKITEKQLVRSAAA
jgi:hypothetical protein